MSVKKLQDWFDDRLGLSEVFGFLTKKAIPQHKHTIWYYTGSAILLFFVIQVVTGFMLAFYYQPTLEQANASVARIISEVPLGWIIRSIHSWSSSFMIGLVFIHLLSIWITKSYRKPREMTWMTGVLLVGQWVTSLLRGGGDVTGDTLTRFFGIHISILPVFAFLLLAVHIFLIQKHGISYPLEAEKHKERVKTIPFWPNFVYREMVVWLVLLGVFLTVAILMPHPLGDPADLMAPAPEGIKPEWYFLFLFQTLKIFPAHVLIVSGETLAVLLILFFAVLFFFLPLIDTKPEGRRGRIITYSAYVAILYAVIMSIWSLL